MAGGKRGPAKTPSNIVQLRGNPGKRAVNKNEPQPKMGAKCPHWLSKYAKKEWKRVYDELKNLRLVTLIDQAVLAGYCESYAKWREAEEMIKEQAELDRLFADDMIQRAAEGKVQLLEAIKAKMLARYKGTMYISDKGNLVQHPAVGMANQAKKEMLKFSQELGMSPASRARLATPNEDPQIDLFDTFIANRDSA